MYINEYNLKVGDIIEHYKTGERFKVLYTGERITITSLDRDNTKTLSLINAIRFYRFSL